MTADVRRADGVYQAVTDGLAVTSPDKWRSSLDRYAKERVVLGIRPDAISVDGRANSPAGRENVVVAEVDDVEPLIGETAVTLKLPSGQTLSAVFQETGGEVIAPGDVLHAAIDADCAVLFDPDSEQALAAAR